MVKLENKELKFQLMANSSSLKIKMEINYLNVRLFFLKLKLRKHRAIFPLIIPALLVGLKVVDIMLERRKKK